VDKPKTFGIKLSELRACDSCGGKLAPFFQHIQIRHAIFNSRNVNAVLGTMQIWSQSSMQALKVAEALAPGADDAVEVLDESETTTELFLCNECLLKPICLGELLNAKTDLEGKDAR